MTETFSEGFDFTDSPGNSIPKGLLSMAVGGVLKIIRNPFKFIGCITEPLKKFGIDLLKACWEATKPIRDPALWVNVAKEAFSSGVRALLSALAHSFSYMGQGKFDMFGEERAPNTNMNSPSHSRPAPSNVVSSAFGEDRRHYAERSYPYHDYNSPQRPTFSSSPAESIASKFNF